MYIYWSSELNLPIPIRFSSLIPKVLVFTFVISCFSSVQFNRSVVSDSLQPHESQHAKAPCSSPTPRVYPNSCPWSHFSYLEPVCCSMSTSVTSCCFLTCIQISQEAGQVVWYSHLFQNFPQFIVFHTVS